MFAFCEEASAQKNSNALKRWGIITSKTLSQTGISELLTARLSETADVELVERDQLDLVTKELELSALAGPNDAAKRLILGRVLAADAIMLIDTATFNDQQFVKVVVSDTRNGVRLWIDYLPYSGNEFARVVELCGEVVPEVQRRFRQGVQHVLAISCFRIQGDHTDVLHLDCGLSYLFASALDWAPGVAVVDLDEAQTIRELTRKGDGQTDAIEAAFVAEARALGLESSIAETIRQDFATTRLIECDVKTATDRDRPQFDVRIQLLYGSTPKRIVEHDASSIGQLTTWLASDAVRKTLTGIVTREYDLPTQDELLEASLARAGLCRRRRVSYGGGLPGSRRLAGARQLETSIACDFGPSRVD